MVRPDVIAFLKEYKRIDLSQSSRSHEKNHLTNWDRIHMRAVHEQFEHFATLTESDVP